MRVAHDPRHARRAPHTLAVGEFLSAEVEEELDAKRTGREYVAETVREPRKFLPPPRVRSRRQVVLSREPESRLSKVAKLAGLMTATSLLAGAVVASSIVTRARPGQEGRPAPVPPSITGAAALDGFVRQDVGKPSPGQPPQALTTTTKAADVASAPAAATGSPLPSPITQGSTTASAPIDDTEKVAVVKEFYDRVASQRPEDALAMLAPGVTGDQSGDLVRAWHSVASVDVNEVDVRPDGSVLAVVTMLQRDGTRLRVTQALALAANPKDTISQVVLLSAEQL